MIYSPKQQQAIEIIIDKIKIVTIEQMYSGAEAAEEKAIRHGQDPYKAILNYYNSLLK